ncbi:hypothetical protein BDY21DRAFT_329998 [Lineolata rhizophorae]|uniref:Uncharacterized protein n=1 Tax=Lineolata rhizophorae TaxID=578093 RepID=A0A6A6PD73_9PEZI|nr:hypothetical protein BDY21DRAFT_329998 [Lineolata rhizophorae]
MAFGLPGFVLFCFCFVFPFLFYFSLSFRERAHVKRHRPRQTHRDAATELPPFGTSFLLLSVEVPSVRVAWTRNGLTVSTTWASDESKGRSERRSRTGGRGRRTFPRGMHVQEMPIAIAVSGGSRYDDEKSFRPTNTMAESPRHPDHADLSIWHHGK